MNFFKKIVNYIKNTFTKQEVKKLENLKQNQKISKRPDFVSSLKAESKEKEKKRIETLICEGDGLGIRKKISY